MQHQDLRVWSLGPRWAADVDILPAQAGLAPRTSGAQKLLLNGLLQDSRAH